MCNCKRILRVRSIIVTPAVVTLVVDRLFSTLGANSCFTLRILRGILPKSNTGQIVFTDPAGTTLIGFNRLGNFLRNDSLHDYVCRQATCNLATDLSAFIGTDPAHISVMNKGLCPSGFLLAEDATVAFSLAAPTASSPATFVMNKSESTDKAKSAA